MTVIFRTSRVKNIHNSCGLALYYIRGVSEQLFARTIQAVTRELSVTRVCEVAQYTVLQTNAKVYGMDQNSHSSPSQTLGPIWMPLQIYHPGSATDYIFDQFLTLDDSHDVFLQLLFYSRPTHDKLALRGQSPPKLAKY